MATYTTKSCPYCNQKYEFMAPKGLYYGSPFRTCTKCRKVFIDKDYIEVGLNPKTYKPRLINFLSIFFLIGGFLFTWAANYLGGWYGSISYFGILFGLFFIIYDIASYKGRLSEYEEELKLSNIRLSDPEYVLTLKEIGCNVPKERLNKAIKEKENRPG